MATERFANGAASSLNGGIDAVVDTLTVFSVSGFPNEAQFRLRIEDEILLVNGIAGSTFNVLRGQEGTTAHSHPHGAAVVHVITAGALAQLKADAFSPGGDLTGSAASQTVQSLRGYGVASAVPQDGQALTWNAAGGAWTPGYVGGSWIPLTGAFNATAAGAGSLTMTQDLREQIRVGDPIRVLQSLGGYVDGLSSNLAGFLSGIALTGVTAALLDARGCLHVKTVDNGNGTYHAEVYSNGLCLPASLIGHTGAITGSGTGTVTEDGRSGLGGTLSFTWSAGTIYASVSVSFYRWYTVESLTDTTMTLFGPALDTTAGATLMVWKGIRSNVSQVSLLVPGAFALQQSSALLAEIGNAYVAWDLPEAHVTRVRAAVKTACVTAHPVVNLNASGVVLMTGLSMTSNATWYSSGATILPKTAHLPPGTGLEVSTTQGDVAGTLDSDLSVSVTVVLE